MKKIAYFCLKNYLFQSKKKNTIATLGFTLIELIIVMIISSILTAIAIPSFLGQTGKAREVEFKSVLGAINRSQQAYHFEIQTFAQGATYQDTLILLGISLDNKYIDELAITGDTLSATVTITNNDFGTDGTRAYSGGTYFDGLGLFSTIVCRSFDLIDKIDPPIDKSTCPSNAEAVF